MRSLVTIQQRQTVAIITKVLVMVSVLHDPFEYYTRRNPNIYRPPNPANGNPNRYMGTKAISKKIYSAFNTEFTISLNTRSGYFIVIVIIGFRSPARNLDD